MKEPAGEKLRVVAVETKLKNYSANSIIKTQIWPEQNLSEQNYKEVLRWRLSALGTRSCLTGLRLAWC